MEKHFCDVCKEETKNKQNVVIEESYGNFEHKFDVCDKCLKTKGIAEILKKLTEKVTKVTISLSYDFLKEA